MKKIAIFLAWLGILAAGTNGFAQTSSGNILFFLKLDGIDGESMDPAHQHEIDLVSFKAGVIQKLLQNFAGGGAAAGHAAFQPIKIFKHVDKSSPMLFVNCATGRIIKNAVITARYENFSGGPIGDFFTITLSNVVIASVDDESAEENSQSTLLETVTLSFTRIQWSYAPVNGDGQLQPPITGGFDLKTDRPVVVQ